MASKRNGPWARRMPASTDLAISISRFRIADVEGPGRLVDPPRQQLRSAWRALHVLPGQARDHPPGQVVEEADGAAFRREVEVAVNVDQGVDVEELKFTDWFKMQAAARGMPGAQDIFEMDVSERQCELERQP